MQTTRRSLQVLNNHGRARHISVTITQSQGGTETTAMSGLAIMLDRSRRVAGCLDGRRGLAVGGDSRDADACTHGRSARQCAPASSALLGPGPKLWLLPPAPPPIESCSCCCCPSCCIARNFSSSSFRAASVSCGNHVPW